MKNKCLIALPLFVVCAVLVGCATDTGVYVESQKFPYPLAVPVTISRQFDLPEFAEVISPCPGNELLGRWRCYVDVDSVHFYGESTFTHNSYEFCWGGMASYWYLIECEFRGDGTYSMWRVSRKSDMILPETETTGRWSYELGELSLTGCPKISDVGESFWSKGVVEGEVLMKLDWHSAKEFTASYRDVDDFVKREAKTPVETPNNNGWGGNGWYDDDGCLNQEIFIGDRASGRWSYIVSPLRFKKQ